MGIEVDAMPVSWVVHFLAIAGAVLVLVWNLHFRGGIAWESSDKSLIFNDQEKTYLPTYPSILKV
ncbi:hypothetical protein CDL15_Pgr022943 [Punica granatum]|uniref:Uncharacterized protein n=1 Tax=Punica granatum TaxID=22663 RepID=A0A218X4W0_PUNGR|nr:hypothetical protein CDL15_Pgr022943 [Punica granatum]